MATAEADRDTIGFVRSLDAAFQSFMENLSDSRKNDVLPELQAFLLEKKLAREKNVFFCALWASKFLVLICADRHPLLTMILENPISIRRTCVRTDCSTNPDPRRKT
ncbi:MAG: hypothetical protein GX874_08490 [Smithella sp.]|nr:hypothetical protein [Smithella sp.]